MSAQYSLKCGFPSHCLVPCPAMARMCPGGAFCQRWPRGRCRTSHTARRAALCVPLTTIPLVLTNIPPSCHSPFTSASGSSFLRFPFCKMVAPLLLPSQKFSVTNRENSEPCSQKTARLYSRVPWGYLYFKLSSLNSSPKVIQEKQKLKGTIWL